MGGADPEDCNALPIPLETCRACGGGIKPARGWTWIHPAELLGLPLSFEEHGGIGQHLLRCPLLRRDGLGVTAGLLWVGEHYYPDPLDFQREARSMGVSRRIPALPRGLSPGHWVLLAHRKGCSDRIDRGEPLVVSPGVFMVFQVRAIEYVVRGDETESQLEKLERRGLQLVKVVPVDDTGHSQGELPTEGET